MRRWLRNAGRSTRGLFGPRPEVIRRELGVGLVPGSSPADNAAASRGAVLNCITMQRNRAPVQRVRCSIGARDPSRSGRGYGSPRSSWQATDRGARGSEARESLVNSNSPFGAAADPAKLLAWLGVRLRPTPRFHASGSRGLQDPVALRLVISSRRSRAPTSHTCKPKRADRQG